MIKKRTDRCPVCHHTMARSNMPRHSAIAHTEQCPLCSALLPPAHPGANHKQITIRTHMLTVHGISLRAYQIQQRQAATPRRAKKERTQATPQTPLARTPRPVGRPPLTALERRRNRLVASIRRMAEGPKKEAARRVLVEVVWEVVWERRA